MSDLVARTTLALQQLGIAVDAIEREDPNEVGWRLELTDQGVDWTVIVVAYPVHGVVACYSYLDGDIEPARRPDVMELITRLNSGLVDGAFELDLDDGEVRFKASRRIVDAAPLEPQVDELVAHSLEVFDAAHGALDHVATGSSSVAEALIVAGDT